MKYLGIDFGLRRVGLSISEGNLASPFKILEGKNFEDLISKIKKETLGFDKIVIGLPEGRIAKLVKKVSKALKTSGLDVVEVPEVLSTQNAIKKMIELGIPKKKRVTTDSYSATLILQDYLDNYL